MKRLILTLTCMIVAGVSLANHWTPIEGTQYNMTMSGVIFIDGVEQTGTNLEVGAFCGDECRGSMLPEFFPPSMQYVVSLTVVSNQLSVEEISFRLYNHDTQQELDVESINNTTFQSNAIIGTLGDWYEFSFVTSAPGGNHWTPIGGTQYNMTMSGVILIDGVEQTGTNLEVGAFCGEECRGSMLPEFFPPSQQYVVSLTVVSNQLSGEEITFRLYDHATLQELDVVSVNNTTFQSNAIIGTFGDWYEFSFVTSAQPQIFTLPITGYSTSTSGYYLIAPPIDDVNPDDIEGMTDGDFDLYYFDQAQELEWVNYKAEPFNLESGKGYLYAHKTDVTLTFTGAPYSGNGQVPLAYTAGNPLAGWNLVGNPFGQTAYLADGRDFYVMKDDGSEIIPAITNGIQPMQGVFVVAANADDNTVTFTTDMPAGDGRALAIEIGKDRSISPIDRAIVRFGEGRTLPKFMLNEGNTKVYLPQGDTKYAVVRSDSEGQLPVNFKAAENGTYTFSVNADNLELDYLHLIDHITGADIDLLQQPSYTFQATGNEYEARFMLVFKVETGIGENMQETFCYAKDGVLYINAETENATLQIVDAMGRIVYCRDGACTVSTNGMAPGVYVFRLINGENVKTQKIIIQ